MCGIAGILSSNTLLVSREQLLKMTNALSHRGLDGEGFWIEKNGQVGFGHRRLAIIDLTNDAAQPMHLMPGVSPSANKEDRYTITYNGEIYNYLEIKSSLQKKGYRFQSQSDTEVVLAAYDYWKKDCLQHFDGMFAFAIWDNKDKILFAARDRFGEKPFYYFEDKEQFVFGSEMKALWAVGIPKKTDNKMLLNYLALGYVQNANDKEQTFFEDIFTLPPAHYLQISFSKFQSQIHCYWNIDKEHTIEIENDKAVEQFNELLFKSVRRRLRSDVAVGTSLSGGLDSSSIAAIISQFQKNTGRLQTFSAVFPGFEKDESPYIKMIAKKFRLQNFQTTPTAEGLIDDFETLCYHQEEPFGSSSIYAQYKVFELAKHHHVKVLLDGQGADETLAGYNQYIHWYLQQLINRNQFSEAFKERQQFRRNQITFKWSFRNYLAAYLPSHACIQLERNEYHKTVQQPDINPELFVSLRGREWEGIHKPIISKLNDILYFNTHTLGLEELLRYADRNSMAHGREVRLPFLNHELVEFIFSLPAKYKIHNGWTKWILRSAMNKKLPNEIVWCTNKVGYEPPQRKWMQSKILQDYMYESKKKLVNNRILKSSVLSKKVLPLGAHVTDNFDWRYLCAAQII